MLVFFMILILTLLAVLAASLRSIYGVASLKELKRRAHKGDQIAVRLYQVSRHGLTADLFLLALSIAASALNFVLIADALTDTLAVIVIAVYIVVIFLILPKRSLPLSRSLALKLSPYFAKVLIKMRPITNKIAELIRKKRPVTVHTGLYEKEDLLDLLQRQKVVPHNRIEAVELDMAAHVLTFGDKKVGDHMVPKRAIHFVNSEDPIGPILLTELYDSGFSRFPVRNHEEAIVGTLFLKDLVDKRVSGIVSNVMSKDVFYVNDTASLEQVMAAFLKTKHHLFIVVNSFEEVVGIISIEDVLEQMIGRRIVDEFDRFDDMRMVATKEAAQDEKEHVKP